MKQINKAKSIQLKSLSKQNGLSLISWIIVIGVLGFCAIFAVRLVPMYSENMYVEKALKSLSESGAKVNEMSDSEIKKKIMNFYLINNVTSKGPENIVIDRSSKSTLITIDYENRTNLFSNIDVVARFQNHLDADQPNLCCKPLADSRATKR
ncbi:MAG: DUF4845 domain-containing protein [Gammaproteobacteria bacterium]|nr:MAG: DUF4845 domain-containing protein [Gammaproteobacteria bacterium]